MRTATSAAAIAALACCIGGAHADIAFRCPQQLAAVERDMPDYLRRLKIPAAQVVQRRDDAAGVLSLTLATPAAETRTLDFFVRPEFALALEPVRLPAAAGRQRVVATVSRKEIVLALLQHGRVTELAGAACSVAALADHVGVRQNIVAWAENLDWTWPDGGAAKWNGKYWRRGTPRPGVPLHAALLDAFVHQEKYGIGCYTAAKLVVVQGTLDYYRRVKADRERARRVEAVLLADGEPLVDVEPGAMWRFEADFDPRELARPGKLLVLHERVAADNFIPGDWGYLLNTDAASGRKTGYEGSNALYLGRNRFGDFYNDRRYAYTYEQKLDEVYQWRNGVFNRRRDAARIKPLAPAELARLGRAPSAGGIQLEIRVAPRTF